MTDRIDSSAWPTKRGPWPEVTDLSRLYDHGRSWCINAAGHPGEAGYPDAGLHAPWDECHGPDRSVQARDGLAGKQGDLCVYVAAPFRFGQPRAVTDNDIRVIIETHSADAVTGRSSLSLGEALRLARMINQLVDDATMPVTPLRETH
jgi:hypothetical protein